VLQSILFNQNTGRVGKDEMSNKECLN
jgi:hypothetical protein